MGKNDNEIKLTEEQLAAKAEQEADTDEEQKVYKKRKWQHKLKLGTHYRMERFTIMFFSLVAVLALFFVSGWNSQRIAQNEKIGTQAQYTEQFQFSLSGLSGRVEGIYRDSDEQRAYVLLQMDDVSKMSTDAKNYEIFLTGFNKQLEQEPSGSMFMFGSSGYVGLEFYDERGLANEIYAITLRNNSEVTNATELTEEELDALDDPSFGRFDQTEIYVNVGAEEVTTMEVLDKDLDAVQLYYALVGRYEEEEIFARIDEQTNELGQLIARHNENANRLVNLGFEAPPMPNYMDGDYIDDDGNFQPRTYVQGAHKIDYIGLNSTDGFVSQVVNDVSEFRDYMAEKRTEERLVERGVEEPPRIETIKRDDGYELPLIDIRRDESTQNEMSARDAVESLMSTWTQYLSVKRNLQITTMRDLLLLDADVRTQGNAFSVHSGEDFLTIW